MTPQLEKEVQEIFGRLNEMSADYDIEYVLNVTEHRGADNFSMEKHSFNNGGVLEIVIKCLLALVYGIR